MKKFLVIAALLALVESAYAEDSIPVNDLNCVVKSATHVRNAPDGEFIAAAVAAVRKGDHLAPTEVDGHWLHFQVERHTHGWISNKDLTCQWEPKDSLKDASMTPIAVTVLYALLTYYAPSDSMVVVNQQDIGFLAEETCLAEQRNRPNHADLACVRYESRKSINLHREYRHPAH